MKQPEQMPEILHSPIPAEMRSLPRIGQVLIEDGAITLEQLRNAMRQQAANTERLLLGEVLLQMNLVNETTMLKAVARSLEMELPSQEQ